MSDYDIYFQLENGDVPGRDPFLVPVVISRDGTKRVSMVNKSLFDVHSAADFLSGVGAALFIEEQGGIGAIHERLAAQNAKEDVKEPVGTQEG